MNDVLFPGCMVRARVPFIESAFRYVLEELGIGMDDLQGQTCCMEPVGLRSLSRDAWLAVGARLHSAASGRRIVTLCEGCNLSLSGSSEILRDGVDVCGIVPGDGTVSDVSGSLQFIYDNLDALKEKLRRPFGMRLAVFPGCHCEYVCSKNGTDAVRMMEEILRALGSDPVRTDADLCCGGGVAGTDRELDRMIISETVSSFRKIGADAAAVACPFCFMRFDMSAKFRTYHIAEIAAIALGYDDTTGYHISKEVQ
jgi:heterodisulfide reductase subunit B